ncbi:peptidoglycan editing factor PgeF [Steroidobacter agaridevorans]|uniref:peptidoglycan editing factor PgeF n=1 Tax=Steroidobacter agaridevorans TaxID=2695856 RepID=UPI001328D540|nr:peptidoglycan editing factor PgeF [Steroidobacter agaridevorans]GFE88239.1 laccase domain protein [Steroidobacter agaridevorans]
MADWITPDWPAPPNVKAAATLRTGGVSQGAFSSLNLGSHVGDEPAAVAENRCLLGAALELPAEPTWLNQVHGINVVDANSSNVDGGPHDQDNPASAEGATPEAPPTADASVARGAGAVCVVMTADCLPVLFCDRDGMRVGAAHAGWRGLAGGVLGATIKALDVPPSRLMAWLGPAIEQDAFEVGGEVHEAFLKLAADNAAAFKANARGRWQADLYQLARNELTRLGVTAVYGGGFKCFADSERFFSYRRESRTGRMASLVWLER